ncbi:hypothetical protein MY1884_009269 [Beauveria asiatica]
MSSYELISKIQYHLQNESPDKRAPNGIDAALESVCAGTQTPERRLLETSLPAWVALVSERDTARLFNQLSAEEEALVVSSISKLSPSPNFMRNVKSVFCLSGRGAHRRQCVEKAGLAWLLDSEQPKAKKRRHADGNTESVALAPSLDSTHRSPPMSEIAQSRSPPLQPDAISNYLNVFPDLNYSFDLMSEPRARNLPRIFKQRMCDGIVKQDARAKVSIFYAPDPTDCTLQLEVLRLAVPDLATNLYGIVIKDKEPGWKIEWEQGAEMNLDGSDATLKISRCSEASIGRWVGDSVLDSLRESWRRKMEIDNGDELTQLVSLTIRGDASSSALLEVKVNPSNLGIIRNLLWS